MATVIVSVSGEGVMFVGMPILIDHFCEITLAL